MKNSLFLVLIMLSCMIRPSQAQTQLPSTKGEIRGKVTDHKTKKPLDFVSVNIINSKNKIVAQVLSDDDGNYIVKQLEPDEYTIKVNNIGYLNYIVNKLQVTADNISFQNIYMSTDNEIRTTATRVITCCCAYRRVEAKNDLRPQLLSLQAQYQFEKDQSFNCVMEHKSREIEQKLKESSVKLFNEVKSFPSPSNTLVNIESMYDGLKEIVIRNIGGLEVYHGTIVHHLQLEVSAFPVGLYVIMIIDKANDERTYSKFVVMQ